MFPTTTEALAPSPAGSAVRRRLVRTLDAAVEFATLGEYGVEEVEIVSAAPATCAPTWDWPSRCEGRARLPRLPRRGALAPTGAGCA